MGGIADDGGSLFLSLSRALPSASLFPLVPSQPGQMAGILAWDGSPSSRLGGEAMKPWAFRSGRNK